MSSIRNRLRPKHQVLVLKCYPKFQKNVPEVKPNSSELSYLLYYASTRRSKVQKVGAYLEEKTRGDVSKGKIGNVQVTLRILTALIDRTRRDLTLYAPYVLSILKTVLASKNLGLVEDSVITFQAFCEHQDVATFAADQTLIKLYQEITKIYCGFGQRNTSQRGPLSTPESVRWRTAGLTAIKSITRSEAVGVDSVHQLENIIPVILGNLYSETGDHVISLHAKLENSGPVEKDGTKGRPSLATQGTNETTDGTTEEADRIAEEEVGVLALQCLKYIFDATNRNQIRIATQEMLKYILRVVRPAGKGRPGTARTSHTTASMLVGSWATCMLQMVTRWTPVQDRFVIMVTTMEELIRSPIAEPNLGQQLVLVILVDSLLSSSINMIGLSVMDVLLGLVQHILLLLQLGGKGSTILPHHQQTDAIDLFSGAGTAVIEASPTITNAASDPKDEEHASTTRQQLLDRLQICVGALANHIYYSDQISDMITAVLFRLKPSPMSSISNPIAAVQNPEAAAQAIADSVKMQEDPRTDDFFSFGTARVIALNAIKEILVVANSKASVTGAGAVSRNRIHVQIWEGTQWLLRDEDRRVRRAYVDALVTWLKYEMSKNDLSVMEDREPRKSSADTKGTKEPRRAASSASRKTKPSKVPKSTFLQLLHLAIYDNALETPEDEPEILLLHLLLYHLVEKLGVNAVQHGLPMIMRLQEDINQLELISTPKAKIVIGSLVHGYLWNICEQFELSTTIVGQEVVQEIQRRKQHHLWLQAVAVPPVPLDKIMIAGTASAIKGVDTETAQTEVLRPFDDIQPLVTQLVNSYNSSRISPPSSPPAGSNKTFTSAPMITTTGTMRARELPEHMQQLMLSTWTKAECLALIESELTRTGSVHGSYRGTLRSHRNGFLHADGTSPRNSSPSSDATPSPGGAGGIGGRRGMTRGLNGANSKAPRLRTSVPPDPHRIASRSPGGGSDVLSTGSNAAEQKAGVVRFEDLKRVLDSSTANRRISDVPASASSTHVADFASISGTSGGAAPERQGRVSMSVGSESMVEAEGLTDTEEEEAQAQVQAQAAPLTTRTANNVRPRTASQTRGSNPGTPRLAGSSGPPVSGIGSAKNRTRSSSTTSAEDPEANMRALRGDIVPAVVRTVQEEDPDGVPPVPPLPEGLIGKINVQKPATNDFGLGRGGGGGGGGLDGSMISVGSQDRRSNAERILSGIDAEGGNGGKINGGVGRPPY